MATTFFDLLEAVESYYGAGSDQWVKIAQYGVTQETLPILKQVPGVNFTYSNSGKILGYDYINPFPKTPNPAEIIDSNIGGGGFAFDAEIPGTVVTDVQTGIHTIESGAKVASSGAKFAAIADKVSLGLAGVAIGTQLGKAIDSALYSIDPEWWDENYPYINPETWDDMCTSKFGKSVIRGIFGLHDDSATMYLPQELMAYTYMLLLQQGAWNSGEKEIVVEDDSVTVGSTTYHLLTYPVYQAPQFIGQARYSESSATLHTAVVTSGAVEICFVWVNSSGIHWEFYSKTPFSISSSLNASASAPVNLNSYPAALISGYPIYYATQTTYFSNFTEHSNLASQVNSSGGSLGDIITPNNMQALAHILLYQSEVIEEPALEGVTANPNAGTQINPSLVINANTGEPVTPEDSVDDVLQALKNAYPGLFDNAIYEDVMQDDGTIQRIYYFPVPYPDTEDATKPVTDTTQGIDPQTDHDFNEDTRPEEQVQQWVINITYPPTTPDTGGGDTPPYVPPTGTANALYAVYNPTQAELNSFGAWLWSSNFVDQLLKLFNDPMQAIIGLHKVFAPPPISGASTIKVGYLDSGVSSNTVGGQYVTVNCGTVSMPEYFGNVFDYDPFTQVHIYLPFIGIEPLDVGDVMRAQINVVYHVDVITGACLAEVNVIRDGAGGTLYTYSGNAAVQYPVSSGSYMGIVASLASVAGGIVGTVASGGALAPLAFGAVSGIMNAHTRVNHSGSFSGNAGAMGLKKPYLIITRPQTAVAETFPAMDGYPANKSVIIGECNGFVAFDSVHVETSLQQMKN